MTATPDLLAGLVEDQTYQVSTGADGSGDVRWHLFRYQRGERGELEWRQVETATSITPQPGRYRDVAHGWLRSLGHDPDTMDLVLILPDGVWRNR